MMCSAAVKELNPSLLAIAEAGRDVPTAMPLALEDVIPGVPRFWRTGDLGPDAVALLQKWRRAFCPR